MIASDIKPISMNYYLLFDIAETYSPIIPLSFFLIKRGKASLWSKLLLWYLIGYIVLSLYISYLKSLSKNNIVFYIIISIATFCFFALILEQFCQQRKFKIINRIVIPIAILFCIINAIWLEGSAIFNSYSSGLNNLVVTGYCIYYYKLQLENPQIIFVEKQPSFWIVSGIFIYSAGNFFLFSMFNSLTNSFPLFALHAWDINDVLILIMNVLFAKGLQCNWHQ